MDKLTQKISQYIPESGRKILDIPGVYLFKNIQPKKAEPTIYQTSMVFITSGSKDIHQNEKVYSYGKGKFLLVSIPTPFTCEAKPGEDDIFAGISIAINKNDLFDLIKQLGTNDSSKKKHNLELGVVSLDITDKIYNALDRLLECGKDTKESQILGPAIIKEIMFYAIQEPEAQNFCELVLTNKNLGTFGNMIDDINKNYKSDISIEGLAQNMSISIPTFYRQFKFLTGFSPNQYIKNLRLSKAKDLLISYNYSIKEVANEVGYNSQSQFSREYKRYFGYAPVLEGKQ